MGSGGDPMYLVLQSASVFRIDDVVLFSLRHGRSKYLQPHSIIFGISNRHFRHVNQEEAKKERAEALSPI
jgi:hypothetical protein